MWTGVGDVSIVLREGIIRGSVRGGWVGSVGPLWRGLLIGMLLAPVWAGCRWMLLLNSVFCRTW